MKLSESGASLTPLDTNWKKGSGATSSTTQDLFCGGAISIPAALTNSTTKTNGKPISIDLQRKWHPGQSWEIREYTAHHWRGGHRNLSEELRSRPIDLQWYSFQSFNSS